MSACKATDDASYYWGADAIDPTEPDYVKDQGILIQQTKPCRYVAEPGKDLCYKHRFIAESQQQNTAPQTQKTGQPQD